MGEPNKTLPRWTLWTGLGLFLASFALYVATVSPEAYPGESASLIVTHLGLDHFPPLTHFFWGLAARFIAVLPFSTIPFKLNLFSALCASLTVWLLYALMIRIEHNRTFE